MSAAESKAGKSRVRAPENDVYTALLGLAVLVLAATIALVCYRSYDLFGSIEAIFRSGA